MPDKQFRFLEERLSPFRAEYLQQVLRNVPKLLDAFDRLVLGGYSEEKERQFRTNNAYAAVALDPFVLVGREDRPVYDTLSAAMDSVVLRGEAREAFLYGLRRALLNAQTLLGEREKVMRHTQEGVDAVIDSKDQLPKWLIERSALLAHNRLEALRGVSSGYRDVYRVMVDVVRQALPK